MLRRRSKMPGQRRPKGVMWVVSPTWKREVQDAMASKGISRAELSRLINVSDAAITILFRPSTKQSRLVPAINRALGLTPPTQSSGEADGQLTELHEIWPDLDDEARRALLVMAGVARRARR
jgi:ribosome-binding protein aMBF1 (putative translation factor)